MQRLVMRGALIVLEGIDRVGKSTQTIRLKEALDTRQVTAQVMTFPNRLTPIGQMINEYLKGDKHLTDEVIHLLFSANRWELREEMLRLLSCGTTLIVDRYAFSGVAYSAAKPSLNFEWCRQSDKGLPRPDSVLYLTANEDIISSRSGFGDERYETKAFQQIVKQNYENLREDYWEIINANKNGDEVHKELLDSVLKTIERVTNSGDNNIKKLWID
ncbi:thymidylate kinase-like [Oppia nitens]|uniref:thymidylate kinase-like n=1 Tax=Oppia nitens TaxID=1686743 RepID=UPI0023DC5174|nr:thymidylate kinase-like [Oppia nitens]